MYSIDKILFKASKPLKQSLQQIGPQKMQNYGIYFYLETLAFQHYISQSRFLLELISALPYTGCNPYKWTVNINNIKAYLAIIVYACGNGKTEWAIRYANNFLHKQIMTPTNFRWLHIILICQLYMTSFPGQKYISTFAMKSAMSKICKTCQI